MRLRPVTTCILLVAGLLLSAGLASPGVRVLDPDEMLAVRGGRVEPCWSIDNLPCDTANPDPCGSNACQPVLDQYGQTIDWSCPSGTNQQSQNAQTFPGCVEVMGGGQPTCNLDPDPANKTKCVAVYACSGCVDVGLNKYCDGPLGFLAYLYIYNREYVSGVNCAP